MKLLLSSRVEDIDLLKGMLEREGIACEITNETATLPGAVFYPELWVVNDADFPAASGVLDAFRKPAPAKLAPWKCSCGEVLDGQFMSCWKCGVDRPASTENAVNEAAVPHDQAIHRSQTMDIVAYAGTALVAFTLSVFSLLRIVKGERSVTLLKSSGWQFNANNHALVVVFGIFGLMLAWKAVSVWREERKWRITHGELPRKKNL